MESEGLNLLIFLLLDTSYLSEAGILVVTSLLEWDEHAMQSLWGEYLKGIRLPASTSYW